MPKTNTADIAPAYTYEWTDAEQSGLKRTDTDGNAVIVPTNPANSDYRAFVASGEEAAPYVAPPEPEPLTTEEKINRLLDDYGLSREEMITALQVKTGKR